MCTEGRATALPLWMVKALHCHVIALYNAVRGNGRTTTTTLHKSQSTSRTSRLLYTVEERL
jgi:hypothetical protein